MRPPDHPGRARRREAAYHAGASGHTIEEPMAAIGCGRSVSCPVRWSADIGAYDRVAHPRRDRSRPSGGGDELTRRSSLVKKEHNVPSASGRRSRSRWPSVPPAVCGRAVRRSPHRDLVTGPKTVTLTSPDSRGDDEPIQAIVDAVKYTLDKTPPESGRHRRAVIVLTGGSAMLVVHHRLAETGCRSSAAKPSSRWCRVRQAPGGVRHATGVLSRRRRDVPMVEGVGNAQADPSEP